MSTKWFTVKNDRFSLKEKDVYYLIGWKKKGVRFQAYWEDRPLEVKEVPLPEGSGDSRSKGIICRLEMKLTDLEESGGRLKIFGYEDGEQQTVFWRSARELRRKARRIAWYLESVSSDEANDSVTVTGWAAAAEDVALHAVFPKGSACKAVIDRHARKDVDAELFELKGSAKRGFSVTVTPIPDKMSLKLTAGDEKLRIAVPVGKAAVFRYKA